jgi:hypothetical protein
MNRDHRCEEPACKTRTYFRFCWFHSNARQDAHWQKRIERQPPAARHMVSDRAQRKS